MTSVSDKSVGSNSKSTSGQGSSNPASTVLGFSGSTIPGRPALVRNVKAKDGTTQERDLWVEVLRGIDASRFEELLKIASTDGTYDMTAFVRQIEYQGFDRDFYIKYALSRMSVSQFCRFAIIGAVRGSKFERIVQTCESMPQDLTSAYQTCGFLSGTPKRKTDLTLLRNTASIPHWCAYWMLMSGVQKKITNSDCHAALQFPGAASLPMSKKIRISHLDFSIKFSKLLPGGNFNMNIYLTAYGNAIPVSDLPAQVAEILEVRATSDNYTLTDEEVAQYGGALVQTQRK